MEGAILLDFSQERSSPRYVALNIKCNSASVCASYRLNKRKAIFLSFTLLYRVDAFSRTNHQSFILKT